MNTTKSTEDNTQKAASDTEVRPRLVATLALLGLLALVLGGCGMNDGNPPSVSVTTQEATATSVAQATSVPTAGQPLPTPQQAAATATEWVPPTALVGTPRPGAEATLTAAPHLRTGLLTITNKQGEMVNMSVEIADTDASRELGLMHRAQMDPNAGMLFTWTEDVDGGFWMYNTILPLSIAFISADGTILNVADMQALDTNTTRPAGSYRYALETNQGFFRAHNIVAGDKVIVPDKQSIIIPGLPSCCCDPSAAAP